MDNRIVFFSPIRRSPADPYERSETERKGASMDIFLTPVLCPAELRSDSSEVVEYNFSDFPVYARVGHLSRYPGMRAASHWHNDVEFIVVLNGKMGYFVSGEEYVLRKGQGIFVNADQLHHGHDLDGSDCEFLCFLLPPSLLGTSHRLLSSCIHPVLTNAGPGTLLDPSVSWQRSILEWLRELYALCTRQEDGFELGILGIFTSIWQQLYLHLGSMERSCPAHTLRRLQELRHMVSYIQSHYAEKITLSQIAASGNVCRSGCCKTFRDLLHKTPVAFLMDYRLERSMELLCTTALSVTEIAYIYVRFFQYQLLYPYVQPDLRPHSRPIPDLAAREFKSRL